MVWSRVVTAPSAGDFYDLFNNKCAAITVQNFLSSEEIEKILAVIHEFGLRYYNYRVDDENVPKAKHIFDTHYHYEQKTPDDYFPGAKENNLQYQEFSRKIGFDPALKVATYMGEIVKKPVAIAQQDGKEYTYAMVRELSSSALLHADYAKFIPDYWSINCTKAQYAWNIYLTDPGEGGETVVYNRLWEKEDDENILGETYGYHRNIVDGKQSIEIKPAPGQLTFFNSRNFHEVKASSRIRVTVGGHIGLTDDDEVIMWV
jgi:hypothetical protein